MISLEDRVSRRRFLIGTAIGAGALAATLTGCGLLEKKLSDEDIRKIESFGYSVNTLERADGSINDDYKVIKKNEDRVIALVRTRDKEAGSVVLLKTKVAEMGSTLANMSEDYLIEENDSNPIIGNTLADALAAYNGLRDKRDVTPGKSLYVVRRVFEDGIQGLENYLKQNPDFDSTMNKKG